MIGDGTYENPFRPDVARDITKWRMIANDDLVALIQIKDAEKEADDTPIDKADAGIEAEKLGLPKDTFIHKEL